MGDSLRLAVEELAAKRQELVRGHRLLDQPIGAELIQRGQVDLHAGALDDEDDRRVRAGVGTFQLATEDRPVSSRQPRRDEDEGRLEAAELGCAVGNRLGDGYLVAGLA